MKTALLKKLISLLCRVIVFRVKESKHRFVWSVVLQVVSTRKTFYEGIIPTIGLNGRSFFYGQKSLLCLRTTKIQVY